MVSAVVVGPPEMEVEYPEGPRVPEGDLQTRRRGELVWALRHWLAERPGTWVPDPDDAYEARDAAEDRGSLSRLTLCAPATSG